MVLNPSHDTTPSLRTPSIHQTHPVFNPSPRRTPSIHQPHPVFNLSPRRASAGVLQELQRVGGYNRVRNAQRARLQPRMHAPLSDWFMHVYPLRARA